MSIHVGIAAYGEGIQLLRLKYGDKEMWNGSLTAAETFSIAQRSLFGGLKKEGGVAGLAWWLPGDSSQTVPETLAKKLGLTTATCPGFRGLSSVFFTGNRGIDTSDGTVWGDIISQLRSVIGTKGFYWGANNPYLRKISARVRRPSIGLDPAIALIRMPDDSKNRPQYASNPSHMIYECLVNKHWGMGENPDLIDKTTFEACAQTLYNEQFGLNMIWTRQSEIGKFIGEILDHVQGALFVHPATGKHTLKLLRADYDVDQVPEINPSNATLSTFRRKAWGEISNEVVVTMSNSESGQEATVSAQDLAGIAAEGGVISSSKNYYGVTSQPLAIKLAERDLAAAVNPIATCDATVDRTFWDTVTSDVVTLSWPEYNIERIVFRVAEVTKNRSTVTLSLYEDIFGLDLASYLSPGDTEWINPSQPPTPASYYQMGTLPAYMMTSALELDSPADFVYPEVISSVVVGPDSDDDVSYNLVTYAADVNGTVSQTDIGTKSYKGTWAFLDALPAEATTTLADLPGLRGLVPEAGDFILIGTGPDEQTELCTVQSVTDGTYVLNRGMLDTVPQDWPIGSRAFVIPAMSTAEQNQAIGRRKSRPLRAASGERREGVARPEFPACGVGDFCEGFSQPFGRGFERDGSYRRSSREC
ncbi:hypothetical protein BFN67_17705 [Pseudaminobacter manganicus]|uniref:Tip attachment protein J domain-containing protein n=2 Tax=Manganibacter manganicus TaxID=1873176 RepID=A0A1V8RR35_9HYPH|nr:hypothetical protein BFN67_17705 [Pseudaminobacter manganicus]